MTVNLETSAAFFVPRTLSPARRPKKSEEEGEPRPLCSFFDRAAVVVLGDRGAGKTETFKQAAKEEGGTYLSVRKFLRLSPEPYRGQVLYLDGLDEVRARTEDGSTAIDKVIRRLDQIGRPKFRLSCRAADWFGGLDREALRDVSPDRELTVLRLDPLTEEDITAIAAPQVPDSQDFVSQAEARGVYEFLKNPHTLGLILKVVKDHGAWPATKKELYERACRKLAQEMNEEHARSPRGKVAEEVVLDAAGHLCAVHLCAGTAGFALERPAGDQDFPYIGVLGEDQLSIASVAGRRNLFRSEDPETIVPLHRTLAEYLAARYLVKQIRGGLPIRRVIALLTGADGGVPSDLRGLFAWLACLRPENSASLLGRDPLGIVLYGRRCHPPGSGQVVPPHPR